jgi:O-antigen/teichoic acid export membrane protein
VTRTGRAVAGALSSYFQFALLIVMQFFLAPYVLKYAGQETLGAYSILGQAVGYLGLLDLGFAATFNRYLGRATGLPDADLQFDRVLITGKTFLSLVNLVAGAGCFILAIFIGPLLQLSPTVAGDARLGLSLLGTWTILRTPLTVAATALIAQQQLAYRNLVATLAQSWRLVGSLLLTSMGYGLLGLMVAAVTAEILDAVLCRVRFRRQNPGAGKSWGIPDRALFREMLGFGRNALIINLAVRLIYSSDHLVVGYLYGAVASSLYYVSQMPAILGQQAIMRLSDAASPGVTQLFGQDKRDSLVEVFLRLHRLTLLLATGFAIGLITLNQPFVALWVGPQQFAGHAMNIWAAIFSLMVCTSHVNGAFLLARGSIGIAAITPPRP